MRRYMGRPGALPDEAVIHTNHWGKMQFTWRCLLSMSKIGMIERPGKLAISPDLYFRSLVESTERVISLALILGKVSECLLALSDDCLPNFLVPRRELDPEWFRSPIGAAPTSSQPPEFLQGSQEPQWKTPTCS
jgi:hypothetical protein